MNAFPQVTEAELANARNDPAFRQKLLQRSLGALLARLQKECQTARSSAGDLRMREGVTLAVRLAEMIQTAPDPARDR